ncbi:uncharacterized protein LOC123565633 [Mercenaria mercenaria]|uniref:uncharacterized protein LOC123565633 n=1 Tax=Mercenaria mercenaria TaxID=6596 RepID=UPI001E1E05AB|nr:uncharacterized protein LOC123565633 [Mercenaria mercenaria]
MTSSTNCLKLGIIIVTGVVILLLLLWSNNDSRRLERTRLLVIDSRSYKHIPEIQLDMLKNSNESKPIVESLKRKYGEPHISGIQTVNSELTPEEKERFRICVENGPRDRDQNGSKFWPNEQIRRTHHTYLSRDDAVMMEVGGNKGDDASEFVRLYNPRYIILEPLEEYAKILAEKFKNNTRVTVVNLGLGAKNEITMVKIEGNNACATSKFSSVQGETPLYVTNSTEFLLKIGLGLFDIDLLTMNCEGCEFEALETILSTTLVEHLRNIQFATHSTIPGLKDPIQRYCRIQQLLLRTHRPTYQYKYIWENWRRRDLS